MSKWDVIFDAANRVAQDAGFGPFVHDESPEHCGKGEGRCRLLSGTATDGVQWVYLSIQDRALDPTGDAVDEAEDFGWPHASIGLGYGQTVVRAESSGEFRRAMQAFVGLARPEATTSD